MIKKSDCNYLVGLPHTKSLRHEGFFLSLYTFLAIRPNKNNAIRPVAYELSGFCIFINRFLRNGDVFFVIITCNYIGDVKLHRQHMKVYEVFTSITDGKPIS